MRFELFLVLLGLTLFAVVIEFVRRRKLTESFVLIWTGVAFGGLLLVVARPFIDSFSEWLGVESGTSVLFALAITFVLVLTLYLSMHLTKAEKRIERLAEEVALLRGVSGPTDQNGADCHR